MDAADLGQKRSPRQAFVRVELAKKPKADVVEKLTINISGRLTTITVERIKHTPHLRDFAPVQPI